MDIESLSPQLRFCLLVSELLLLDDRYLQTFESVAVFLLHLQPIIPTHRNIRLVIVLASMSVSDELPHPQAF
jgi:hypothetical protein